MFAGFVVIIPLLFITYCRSTFLAQPFELVHYAMIDFNLNCTVNMNINQLMMITIMMMIVVPGNLKKRWASVKDSRKREA